MKNECSIVRDILPLYSKGTVSKETAAFIEMHLDNCPDCRAEFEVLIKTNEADLALKDNPDLQNSDSQRIGKIKKKFRIKIAITIIIAIVFAVSAISAYVNIMPVFIDRGSSELYYQDDMNAAIKIIKDKINSWHGCRLYSLSFKGDEYCSNELDYCNSLNQDGEPFTECIVFNSCFCSPIWGGGGFENNSLYFWDWYLARTENGQWQLLTWGY